MFAGSEAKEANGLLIVNTVPTCFAGRGRVTRQCNNNTADEACHNCCSSPPSCSSCKSTNDYYNINNTITSSCTVPQQKYRHYRQLSRRRTCCSSKLLLNVTIMMMVMLAAIISFSVIKCAASSIHTTTDNIDNLDANVNHHAQNIITNHNNFNEPLTATAANDQALPTTTTTTKPGLIDTDNNNSMDENENENILVVATIQGELIGLNSITGHVIWKHSQGTSCQNNSSTNCWSQDEWNRLFSPLISTSSTTKPKLPSNTVAVPSAIDGRVYLTPSAYSEEISNEGTSIKGLVNRSPFVDSRGRFYVSNRRSIATAIDCKTGEILRVIKGEQQLQHQKDSHNSISSSTPSLQGRQVIWIGRVDHSVTIYNARTGNVDVTFSFSEILSLSDMIGNYMLQPEVEDEEDNNNNNEFPQIRNEFHLQHNKAAAAALSSLSTAKHKADNRHFMEDNTMEGTTTDYDILLFSTPGGKLAMLSTQHTTTTEETNEMLVIANQGSSFSSAIAFAISSATGSSIKVDIVPDAPIATDSISYLKERFHKQRELQKHDIDASTTVIVGALPTSQQLFALPLGRSTSTKTTPKTKTSPFGSSLIPNNMHLLHHDHSSNSGSSSTKLLPNTNVAVKQHQHIAAMHHHHQQHYHTASSTSTNNVAGTAATTVGVSINNFVTTATTATNNKALSAKKCTQTSPTYPACLIGFHHNIIPLLVPPPTTATTTTSLEHHVNKDDYDLLVILIGGQKYRFTFQTIFCISWIIPLTFVFIISFQLGKRQRNKAETTLTYNAPPVISSISKPVLHVQSMGDSSTCSSNLDITTATLNTEKKITTNNIENNGNRFPHSEERNTFNLENVNDDMTKDDELYYNTQRVEQQQQQQQLIKVSNEMILGYGGHGTVVFQGTLSDGRKVAVKRMLKAYNASADREISLLIESDGHPNVVRYFLKEIRGDFIYLALELCDMSLVDLIYAIGSKQHGEVGVATSGCNNIPSVWLTCTKNTLYQIAAGVRHLHSLRIIHRDLKPQNILLALRNRTTTSATSNAGDQRINRQGRVADEEAWKSTVYHAFETNQLVPKISDMGLGKQLTGESSFGASSSVAQPTTLNGGNISLVGPGTVGWMAPEVMALRSRGHPPGSFFDQTSSEAFPVDDSQLPSSTLNHISRSVDIFSLGCIFYCTLLPGLHPFGEWYEREANIMKDNPNTHALEKISAEAFALVNSMLSRNPRARPTAEEICSHPFFWKPSKRLSFLSDFSDRIELQADNLALNLLVVRVETNAAAVIGLAWDRALDSDLISNVSRFRTYDPSSVRDCLRMIRNKYHHFCELPDSVKDKIGSSLDDLLHYFEGKFPLLMMHCYSLIIDILPKDDSLVVKYGVCSRASGVKSALDQSIITTNGCSEAIQDEIYNMPTLLEEKSADVLKVCAPNAEEVEDAIAIPIGETCETTDILGEMEDASSNKPLIRVHSEKSRLSQKLESPPPVTYETIPLDVVIWEGSSTARLLNCRGWMRSEDEWRRRTDALLRKRDVNITRCVEDPKFRTRLCNHWDLSKGTNCPMRKKNKCIFAHGPVELRVKEGKRCRWGTLVDELGNQNNPFNSGGEDTYGAARSIETKRKEDGQWIADKSRTQKTCQKPKFKSKEKEKAKNVV